MHWTTKITTTLAAGLTLLCGFAWGAPVDWASPEGMSRFAQSDNKHDLFTLAPQFEGQINKVDCGVASAVIVLNALRTGRHVTDIPVDTSTVSEAELTYLPHKNGWRPFWERYTQNTVLSAGPKPRAEIFGRPAIDGGRPHYGLTLADETALLRGQGLEVRLYYLSTVQGRAGRDARQTLIDTLATADTYVLVNINRAAMGQKGGGHISPLGAYDAKSDSFLLMDVSNTNFTWTWVDSHDLLAAMNTVDSDSAMYRGFLVVTEGGRQRAAE